MEKEIKTEYVAIREFPSWAIDLCRSMAIAQGVKDNRAAIVTWMAIQTANSFKGEAT